MADPVAVLLLGDCGTEEAHLYALRLGIAAGGDIGVAAGELADHLSDDVVQVEACLGVGNEHFVLLPHGVPVDAVHVLEIESVAVSAPGLVEDLGPFLLVVNVGYHVREFHAVTFEVDSSAGDVGDVVFAAVDDERFLSDDGEIAFGYLLGLSGGEVKGLGAAAASVEDDLAVAVDGTGSGGGAGHAQDALVDAVGIHLHGGCCSLVILLLLLGLGRGLAVLGQERRRGVLRQHGDVHRAHVGVRIVPFHRAVGRSEVSRGSEYQVLAVLAEDGRTGVVPLLGDRDLLAACEIVHVDDTHLVGGGLGICDPLAVRGEADSTELRFGVGHEDLLGAIGNADLHKAVLAVAVEERLAVRSPYEAADVGVGSLGQLHGLGLLHVLEIDLGLAGTVGDVGDVFPVGGELGPALVGAGRAGDVPGDAGLDGHVEYFSACRDGHAVTFLRYADVGEILVHMHLLGAGIEAFGIELDVDLAVRTVGRVEGIDIASVLEYDPLAVGARELDVVLLEIGDLGGLPGLGVVHEDVHPMVTVGDEEYLVAHPHGDDILGFVVGDGLDGLAVVDPDLVGLAAAVVLPRTELAEDAVVCEFLPVGRIAAETALRQGQAFAHAA